jgi:hypothetical protein
MNTIWRAAYKLSETMSETNPQKISTANPERINKDET